MALTFKVRYNMFRLIRKEILASNCKFWDDNVDDLSLKFNKEEVKKESELPVNWEVEIHDKALLKAVSIHGIQFLSKLKNNDELGFKDILVSKKKLLRRVENLCLYFKENMPKYKNSLKKIDSGPARRRKAFDGEGNETQTFGRTKLDPSKPITACKINKDIDGNVIYPIIVTNTLKILDLGTVEYERPNFHSSRNLFPIGFKSVREYTSMIHPNTRCDYLCEILDGGDKPLYKVTCMDDADNPITKDASSGVWIEICRRIADINGTNRNKVTVSGPDRFGLAEPAVT